MTKKELPRQKKRMPGVSRGLPVLLLFFLPLYSHAYLEPGTLSYVLQFLLAVFVGAAVTGKLYWKKLKKFMKHLFNRKENKKEDRNQ
jgi:hypothetical protein